VDELVVAAVPESRGAKSDRRDAFQRAEELRIGAIKRVVYKTRGDYAALGIHGKVYARLVSDSVRVMSRIKSLFRARGILVSGSAAYSATGRRLQVARLPVPARRAVALLDEELDVLRALRQRAATALVAEARKHPVFRVVKSCPGLGPIRSALLLPIVVTPARLVNKRGFWSYGGLGIVMRSSADWRRTASGTWIKAQVPQTRGLNRNCRNCNRTFKHIFKGAATTVGADAGCKRRCGQRALTRALDILPHRRAPMAPPAPGRLVPSMTMRARGH
jgi:hypothetical protein